MPKLYKFTAFPRQIGFIVAEGEEMHSNITNALVNWAKDEVTKHNVQAYLDQGTIQLVHKYPDTDPGWQEAMDEEFDLTEY